MRIKILETGVLAKPEKLIMYKTILNRVQFLYVIYNNPTRLNYKVPYENVSTNRHTNTTETFRTEGPESNIPTEVSHRGRILEDVLCHVKDSLLFC